MWYKYFIPHYLKKAEMNEDTFNVFSNDFIADKNLVARTCR